MTCTNCGAPLGATDKFCGTCGRPVISTTATSPLTSSVPTTTSTPPAPAIEPPAAVPSQNADSHAIAAHPAGAGPILQSAPRSRWPYVMALVAAVLLGFGGWFAWQKIQDMGPKQASASNQCVAFELPKRLYVSSNGSFCSVLADTFEMSVAVEVLPSTVTTDSLQTFAADDFAREFPLQQGNGGQRVQFAGQPAYRFTIEDEGSDSVRYYVADQQSKLKVDNRPHQAYAVTFSSRGDLQALISKVEQTWQWKARTTPDEPYSGRVRTADGVTECFRAELPAEARYYRRDRCEIMALYGEYDVSQIDARSVQGSHLSLRDHVDYWKRIQAGTIQVIRETDITVDGLPGRKIVYQHASIPDAGNQAVVLVYTGDRFRLLERATGFEIDGNYDAARGEDKAFDAVVASWKWQVK